VVTEHRYLSSGEINYYGIILDEKHNTEINTVQFPVSGQVYEIRSGRKIGEGDEVDVPKQPTGAKLFAVLPRTPVARVDAPSSVKRGDSAELKVSVNIKGRYPFHIVAIKPSGKKTRCPNSVVFAPANYIIPFALNDETGIWKIEIQDFITKKTITKQIVVR
jgi:hypothetical protein